MESWKDKQRPCFIIILRQIQKNLRKIILSRKSQDPLYMSHKYSYLLSAPTVQ